MLSKFITIAGRSYAPLPPKFIVVIFVVFDVVTTVIQIVGAALIGTAESNNTSPKTANNILLAGLAVQVASFAVFLVLLALCILRILQKRGSGTWAHSATAAKLLSVLVVTSLLVELRTIFRLIETAQGAIPVQARAPFHASCNFFLTSAKACNLLLLLSTFNASCKMQGCLAISPVTKSISAV